MLLAGLMYAIATIPQPERQASLMVFGDHTVHEPQIHLQVPGFDTSLGTLLYAEVIFNYIPSWAYWGETTNPLGTDVITWQRGMQVNLTYGDFSGPVAFGNLVVGGQGPSSVNVSGSFHALAGFDGLIDFSGTSGFGTGYGLGYTVLVNQLVTSKRELNYYSSPGMKHFFISPRLLHATSQGHGSHWFSEDRADTNLGTQFTVIYHY